MYRAEFDDYKTIPLGYTHQDLGNLLLSKNYAVYLFEWHPIEKYGSKHKFRYFSKFPTQLKDSNAWGNFIAVHGSAKHSFENFLANSRYKIYYEG